VGSFFPTIGSYLLSASAGASYLPRRFSSLSLGPERFTRLSKRLTRASRGLREDVDLNQNQVRLSILCMSSVECRS
jgi:hypothetical protein